MRRPVLGLMVFLLAAPPLLASDKLDERMMHAASILHEIRGSLDEEAPGVLHNAHAVAVFPEFVKVGLLGGIKHGRGVLATRRADGGWSKPAFVRVTSGSLGLQFGVSISQLLIVFKNPKAVEAISGGQFTIGADAGYAAGNLGGSAGAGTDNKFENETVAMARSKGLFAGVSIEGGVLRIEKHSNVEFYDDAIGLDGKTLLSDTEVELPRVAQHFLIVLDEAIPELYPEAAPEEETLDGDAANLASGQSTAGSGQASPANPFSPSEQPAADAWSAPSASATPYAKPAANAWSAPSASATPYAKPAVNAWSAPSASATPYAKPAANAWSAPSASTAPSAQPATYAWTTPSVSGAPDTAGVPAAGVWVTPEGAEIPSGGPAQAQGEPRDSRLASEVGGRLRNAAWKGATKLAIDAVRSNADRRKVEVAAKVGKELVGAAFQRRVPAAPAPAPPTPAAPPAVPPAVAASPDYAVADTSQWIEPPGPEFQVASRSLGPKPSLSTRTRAEFTGPPPPSEWPEEVRRAQELAGACEPSS